VAQDDLKTGTVRSPCLWLQEVGQVEQPQKQGERRVAFRRGRHGQRYTESREGRAVTPVACAVAALGVAVVWRAERVSLRAGEEEMRG